MGRHRTQCLLETATNLDSMVKTLGTKMTGRAHLFDKYPVQTV
jgi:hypothetical protein